MDIKKYTTVIWDWNGTIVNDSALTYTIYCDEAQRYGLKKLTPQDYKEQFFFPVADFYTKMGLAPEKYGEVADRFAKIYRPRWGDIVMQRQVSDYLQKFKDLGITQYVLSAYRCKELTDMVQFFGLQDYFCEIAGIGDHYAASKIQRGIDLVRENKIDVSKALMIGDTAHDFEVAEAMGTDALLLSWGQTSHDVLARFCGEEKVFESLDSAFCL